MEETSILFLSPPNSFKAGAFDIDPSILLPVETPSPPGEISLEMILSGMLKVISAQGERGAQETAGNRFESLIDNPAASNPTASANLRLGRILNHSPRIKNGDQFIGGETDVPTDWIDYYRSFVLTTKPEIYHEFTSASIVKASNGEFDLALEISGILEGLFPGSSGVLLNKALILEGKAADRENSGKDASDENLKALAAYEKALSMEPVLPDALFNAGFFFMRLGDFSRARDCLSLYISSGEESEDPSEHPTEDWQESSPAHAGFSPEKMRQARKIIRDIKSQGLDDSTFQEAYNCVNRGNDEEGLTKARAFIERHPKVWNGWFVLGWALRKLGRYADGLEALKKAVELGGRSADIKNEMAICLMEIGDLLGARKELESALRDEPLNIKIISNLGVLAQKSGRPGEAAAFFRTVLELDPGDPLARSLLGFAPD